MLAREIMTRDPLWVLPTDPIWRAAEMMRYHGIGCTPVIADEGSRQVVGVLTDRDITTRCVARKHSGNCRVSDHMTATPIHSVTAGDDAARAIQKMEAARVRRVPVLTADGALIGIIRATCSATWAIATQWPSSAPWSTCTRDRPSCGRERRAEGRGQRAECRVQSANCRV